MARTPEAVKAELLEVQQQFNTLYRAILTNPDGAGKRVEEKPRQLQLLADRACALFTEYAALQSDGTDGHARTDGHNRTDGFNRTDGSNRTDQRPTRQETL